MPTTKISKPAKASKSDDALEQYHLLLALLADRVRSVVGRYQTGAYLVGRSGSGKTHTVRRVLEESKASYVILNGRITPAALYDEIEERANSIIVIDDVPTLFDSQHAAQILMAAIGGDPGTSRRVTYVTRAERRITEFTGGVIAISNRPLRRDPANLALASRMATLQHEPTDEMLVAFMRDAARRGASDVPAKECKMVCEYVAEVCRSADYRMDLRHFFKGIEDYRCWKSGVCETDWRILVESAVHRVLAEELPLASTSRAETKSNEHEIVKELHGLQLTGDKLAAEWRERTGKGMDSYYRRKRELRL